jgi:hypothetical protein
LIEKGEEMTRSLKLLLVAVLATVALAASAPRAAATDWCAVCASFHGQFGDCYSCCRCDGGTDGACKAECRYP